MTKFDCCSLLSSHRTRRSNFLLSMLLQFNGHVLFSGTGSLTLLLTIDFARYRVLVKTSWLSLGKADMGLRLHFQGTFRLTNW